VCFAQAVEKGLLATNPAEGVKLPIALGATHEPWTYLPPGERTALLSAAAIREAERLLSGCRFSTRAPTRRSSSGHCRVGSDAGMGKRPRRGARTSSPPASSPRTRAPPDGRPTAPSNGMTAGCRASTTSATRARRRWSPAGGAGDGHWRRSRRCLGTKASPRRSATRTWRTAH
jgi:hypothetical protein